MSNNLESIPIIDAHQHFWDLDNNYYPFLSDNYDKNFFLGDYSSLKRNYLPKDYFLDSKNHNIIGTVHCEAEWDRKNQVGETEWLISLKKKYNLPTSIIAHAWFHTNNAEEIISKQASFKLVKSIRSKPVTKTGEMTSYISNHLRQEINQSNDDIKKQIDDYDEYLYKILVDYIQDKPMSYEILQEFIHERQEQWCYE